MWLFAVTNKAWHVLFYQMYHTPFPHLKEECQIVRNTRMCSAQKGGFTLRFHCSFEIAHPLLGRCASQPLWTHQIQFQAFFLWRGMIRLFYLSSVLQSATAGRFPVFLGRCPSYTSFACPSDLGPVRSIVCSFLDNCMTLSFIGPIKWNWISPFLQYLFLLWDTSQTDSFAVEACWLGVNVC